MPELPEVETIRRGLHNVLPGLVIADISCLHPKPFRGKKDALIGLAVVAVERRAKLLLITLSDQSSIAVHLKMTGQLIWRRENAAAVAGGHPSVSYIDHLPSKHTRVIIHFTDGSQLFFNDLRLFGYVEHLSASARLIHPFLTKVGPEPFDEEFSAEYLQRRLARTSRPIKVALLDQEIVAGLGNIYVDESLHAAKIHPKRPASSLTTAECEVLVPAIRDVLARALLHGGSTERDYRNAIGEKGTYLSVAVAYHRTGLPCTQCGEPYVIERIKLGGRSTHFCAHCQR
jgi:formamidopyrimidine-DNA glycosylase